MDKMNIQLAKKCRLPRKSMIRRPSQNLPEGLPKKVLPLGKGTRPNVAETAPVSEFESPKLYIPGKLQAFVELRNGTTKTMPVINAIRLFLNFQRPLHLFLLIILNQSMEALSF